MADISKELSWILEAVYGEEVRGSIHDAIDLINKVTEKTLTVGTEVGSSDASTIGYYDGSVYINSNTYDMWVCNGNAWENKANIKGATGTDGENGNKWYRGRAVSASSLSNVPVSCNVSDNYLNVDEGKIYHCTSVNGNYSNWVYDMTLTGGGSGGASALVDLNDVAITGAKNGQALTYEDGTWKNKDVQGGISPGDIVKTVDGIKNATDNNKVASAYAVQKFANEYTERVVIPVPSGHNEIGTWQYTDKSEWNTTSEEYFYFSPVFYEADNETVELSFKFDTSSDQPIYMGGYQYVSQTTVVKEGKPCGGLCIKLGNYPDNDINIIVDVTHLHKDANAVITPANTRVEVEYGAVTSRASKVDYDNSASGLEADNVQGAIDEISGNLQQLDGWTGSGNGFQYLKIGKIAIVQFNGTISGDIELPFNGSTFMVATFRENDTGKFANFFIWNDHLSVMGATNYTSGKPYSGTFITTID